ncbi:hypothetical protein N658DRAFT_220367 [Parathielavia hyrcaniae]|uniref:Uncharacterized protein n=1 Tax=Parathielavia hyrcaniae TaxID=113614 RepID=A0AAN6PZZ0_9PEZI|nr:hypothetical protein N658DRAFT_220367 [Parathielavia hyrcaniae]
MMRFHLPPWGEENHPWRSTATIASRPLISQPHDGNRDRTFGQLGTSHQAITNGIWCCDSRHSQTLFAPFSISPRLSAFRSLLSLVACVAPFPVMPQLSRRIGRVRPTGGAISCRCVCTLTDHFTWPYSATRLASQAQCNPEPPAGRHDPELFPPHGASGLTVLIAWI